MAQKTDNSNLNEIDVNYEIKNQVKLFIGEPKTPFNSGCKMFDLVFKDNYQVQKKNKSLIHLNTISLFKYLKSSLIS